MAERLTKKQLKQDQFLQRLYVAVAWMRENPLASLAAVVGLVVIVTLAVRIGGSAAGVGGGNREAEEALIAARTEFAQGRLESGAEALREVTERYRNDRAGREAAYLLGNSLFELGDYEAARTVFEDFLKHPLYDDLLQDGARLAIAACKEESNDLSGAFEDYRRLWETGNSPGTRIQAAFAAARVASTQGRDADARALYQGVIDTYPRAPEADEARFKLLELPAS